MKITVLCENTSHIECVTPEHGLSLYIETENHRILFDAGQTDLFYNNAENIGIDLSSVDIAILSHGHYDHSGGFNKFLEINNKAQIYVNENVFGLYYNGTEKYIGIDDILKKSDRLIAIGDEFNISENMTIYSCNERERLFSSNSSGLNIKKGDSFYQDEFLHEQYLIIKENGNDYLFSSCSHKGILNITNWFKPDYLIGGFHISKLNPETDDRKALDNIATKLLTYQTKYYTGHCTGIAQYKYLKQIMGDKLNYISAGSVLNI